jgi:hypothetical protein
LRSTQEFDRADDEIAGLVLRAVLTDGTRAEFDRIVDNAIGGDSFPITGCDERSRGRRRRSRSGGRG